MKVMIQSTSNKGYLKSLDEWTCRVEDARNFRYFQLAANFVREKNLRHVQFAVPLPETEEVLIFPVL